MECYHVPNPYKKSLKSKGWVWESSLMKLWLSVFRKHVTGSRLYWNPSCTYPAHKSGASQCFLTRWMVHHRVNENVARVNERIGVNEMSVPNFLYPLVTCICFAFLTQNLSAIVNKSQTSSVLTLCLQQSATYHFRKAVLWCNSLCLLCNGDRFHREMPCFIQLSGGISAVLSMWASCTLVPKVSVRIAVLSKVSGIGVGAMKFLRVRRILSWIFPNLPKNLLHDFCLQIFSHKNHEDLFLVWLLKKGLHLFSANVAHRFLKSNNVGCHFYPDFQEFCRDFQQMETFGGALAPWLPTPLISGTWILIRIAVSVEVQAYQIEEHE